MAQMRNAAQGFVLFDPRNAAALCPNSRLLVSQAPSIHRRYVAILPQINVRAVYVAALPPAPTHRPIPIPTLSQHRCGYHCLLAGGDLDRYGNAPGSLRARAIGREELSLYIPRRSYALSASGICLACNAQCCSRYSVSALHIDASRHIL